MKKRKWLWDFSFIGIMVSFLYSQNNWIQTHFIQYQNEKIPSDFDGFKILQVSDLHSKYFGKQQKILIQKVKQIRPNLIFLTGDFLDGRKPDLKPCLDFLKKAVEIAPVYFVSGNHEERTKKEYKQLQLEMKRLGVHCLLNKTERIQFQNMYLMITGLRDVPKARGYKEKLNQLIWPGYFHILLSHRPECLKIYAEQGVDLVFSGHAHGGQFRLPFFGGLFAPNQGIFPKYTSGQYCQKNTTMIVSRGLGDSIFPQRIFNRPELIVVTLKNKNTCI